MFEKQIAKQIEEALEPLRTQVANLQQQVADMQALVDGQAKLLQETQDKMVLLRTTDAPNPVADALVQAARQGAETVAVSIQPECLYLGAPTAEGIFREVSATLEPGKSLYRLEGDGQFEMIDSHEAIATALISVSQMVKPACKIEGRVSPTAKKVTTLHPGKADKTPDGHYVVTQKCVVRFQ